MSVAAVCVGLALVSSSGRSYLRGATALVGVRESDYANGNQHIYRTIKHLAGWKVDWAMGGDEPGTPLKDERLAGTNSQTYSVYDFCLVNELGH